MNSYIKCTRETVAVPRVRIEIGIPADMLLSDLPDLSVEACREIRDALRAMIDTGAETYINDNRDGDAPEWDENDLDEPTGYEPMTLPSEARDILLEQLKRLDKIANAANTAGLCANVDALYSITESMCKLARELRE